MGDRVSRRALSNDSGVDSNITQYYKEVFEDTEYCIVRADFYEDLGDVYDCTLDVQVRGICCEEGVCSVGGSRALFTIRGVDNVKFASEVLKNVFCTDVLEQVEYIVELNKVMSLLVLKDFITDVSKEVRKEIEVGDTTDVLPTDDDFIEIVEPVFLEDLGVLVDPMLLSNNITSINSSVVIFSEDKNKCLIPKGINYRVVNRVKSGSDIESLINIIGISNANSSLRSIFSNKSVDNKMYGVVGKSGKDLESIYSRLKRRVVSREENMDILYNVQIDNNKVLSLRVSEEYIDVLESRYSENDFYDFWYKNVDETTSPEYFKKECTYILKDVLKLDMKDVEIYEREDKDKDGDYEVSCTVNYIWNPILSLELMVYEAVTSNKRSVRSNKATSNRRMVRSQEEIIVATNDTIKGIVKREIDRLGNNADLNHIDTSKVKNMSFLFYDSKFNGDISQWDTSNVKYMDRMFYNSQFSGDISKWDTSNVTNMDDMFAFSEFRGDISNWDTSNVVNMFGMFQDSKFNGDISQWDVSNVVLMGYMFELSEFNGDISQWDTSKVKDMDRMFAYSEFNRDISQWDVSNVKDMDRMFKYSKFNGDISNWDVSNVRDMQDMLKGSPLEKNPPAWYKDESNQRRSARSNKSRSNKSRSNRRMVRSQEEIIVATDDTIKDIVKQEINRLGNKADLNHIDTSKVKYMGLLFFKSQFNGDISQWDTSNVVNMNGMFAVSKFNGDISNWDVSNVTNMYGMFDSSKFNGDISQWDTSNVVYMFGMFLYSKFNGDISNWDTSNVKDMGRMFENSQFSGDISNWDVSKVKYMQDMFENSPLEKNPPAWYKDESNQRRSARSNKARSSRRMARSQDEAVYRVDIDWSYVDQDNNVDTKTMKEDELVVVDYVDSILDNIGYDIVSDHYERKGSKNSYTTELEELKKELDGWILSGDTVVITDNDMCSYPVIITVRLEDIK